MTCSAQRQAELLAQGWRRRFMAKEPRLGEAVATYREIGLAVHLEPVDPAACRAGGGCASCYDRPEEAAQFKVIFTRQAPGPDPHDDPSYQYAIKAIHGFDC